MIMAALFTSCSDEVLPDADGGKEEALQISVTVAGFKSNNPATRSTDVGYTTTFTAGDSIGITVIGGGATIDNVPYKYDGSAWIPAPDTIFCPSGTSLTWLVYYPYSVTMNGKTTEAAIKAAFTPKNDQSTLADYAASDLMTGQGTLSGLELNVTLTHALSLVEINLLPMSASPALSINSDPALSPYHYSGTLYRCIVKPEVNATIDGMYSIGGEMFVWQKTNLNLNAGEYTKLSVVESLYAGSVSKKKNSKEQRL